MNEFLDLCKKIPLLFESLLVVILPSNNTVYADTLLNDTEVSKDQVLASTNFSENTVDAISADMPAEENTVNDSLIKVENTEAYSLTIKGGELATVNYAVANEKLNNAIDEYEEEQELLRQLEEAKSLAKKRELAKQLQEEYNVSVELSGESSGDVWSIANSLVGTPGNCFYICQLFIQAYTGEWRSFGDAYQVSDPQPGDLIYYADGGVGYEHWAIYLGGEYALQGNYNGTTVIGSIYISSGSSPVFYRLP